MHLPRLLLVITALAAQSSCATLRQYSRDWLIAGEEPMLNKAPRRIMAKSVFIAPAFHAARCAQGYREDAHGNCVKLVRVSQTAQLDFLLQKLNAMYGSAEKPAMSPFGGAEPQQNPFAGLAKPESTTLVDIAKPAPLPVDAEKSEEAQLGDVVKREPVPLGDIEIPVPVPVPVTAMKPPRAEPCVELPKVEDVLATSPSIETLTSSTTSTIATSTAASYSETLSLANGEEIVETTSQLPAVVTTLVPEAMEATSFKELEVLLIDQESESLVSSTFKNVSALVENEAVPVVNGDGEMSAVESASVKDGLMVEMNDQAAKDVVAIQVDDEKIPAVFESSNQVLVLGSVSANPLDKDISVLVLDEVMTTAVPESTTAVPESTTAVVDEETSTNDYDDVILVEPEMGSGEVERDVQNVSESVLPSVGANVELVDVIDSNISTEVDKVLPVRNIVPEASSERIQFVDSPITNIQPVRNTYPGGEEMLDIDLKPSANFNGGNLQVHNLNPSKLLPPKYMEEPIRKIPETPFSLDDFINRHPVPPIPVYRPYENLNFNPQQHNFPIQYQQPPLHPRNGFVRFPTDRDQHQSHADQRVNSVRFPPGEQFSDEKLSHWPSSWTLDNRRAQRPPPLMRFWSKMPLIRNSDESSQRYQQDRRRPPPQYYQ